MNRPVCEKTSAGQAFAAFRDFRGLRGFRGLRESVGKEKGWSEKGGAA